ncbi:uncharacterized protein LOC142817991 isoform X4 [Rhipicephalus microplus]|uniref:uncharacterized protein LOC142817991 isoform X4 n=1 Tax=Rhipicephalus microplus TaxID=6941 RepID=UPI003F6AC6EA
MKNILSFMFLSILLQIMWFENDHTANVHASHCQVDDKTFVQKLVELHNSSVRVCSNFGH